MVEWVFSLQVERRMLTERKKLKVQQRLEGKELGESIGDSTRLGKGKAFSLPCMKRETRMGEGALTFKHKIGGDFPGDRSISYQMFFSTATIAEVIGMKNLVRILRFFLIWPWR